MPEEIAPSRSAPSAAQSCRVDPGGFVEEAFFFGPPEAPLYGVLHLPARVADGGRPERPPILHVHSYGIEQVASYRMEVEFARAAAAAGFPVLRFHMTGCGDSFGEFAEVTIDSMVEDVRRASAFVTERGLDGPPALLGVRLGADVAIRAAAALGGARALILWEPVRDPRAYLESLLRSLLISNLAQGKKTGETVATLVERLRRDGFVDVLGYPIHRRIYDGARPLDIAAGARVASEALVVSIGKRVRPPAAAVEIARALRERGVACETRDVRAEPGWQFNANPSFVTAELTEATLGWCVEHLRGETEAAAAAPATPSTPSTSPPPSPSQTPPPARAPHGRIEVR